VRVGRPPRDEVGEQPARRVGVDETGEVVAAGVAGGELARCAGGTAEDDEERSEEDGGRARCPGNESVRRVANDELSIFEAMAAPKTLRRRS
jgi:hypothetical protein